MVHEALPGGLRHQVEPVAVERVPRVQNRAFSSAAGSHDIYHGAYLGLTRKRSTLCRRSSWSPFSVLVTPAIASECHEDSLVVAVEILRLLGAQLDEHFFTVLNCTLFRRKDATPPPRMHGASLRHLPPIEVGLRGTSIRETNLRVVCIPTDPFLVREGHIFVKAAVWHRRHTFSRVMSQIQTKIAKKTVTSASAFVCRPRIHWKSS